MAVKHMKWWGWGVEGVSFNHTNKPAFAPFVKRALDVDLWAPTEDPISFAALDVPAPRIGDDLLAGLRAGLGDANVSDDDHLRVVHWAGKSVRELLLTRANRLGRVPDVVVYPGSEEDVVSIVSLCREHDAVIIPFGGGSNISGSLVPEQDEQRAVISLDMGRMARVLDVDATSGLARVQAGIQGPDLEDQLAAHGMTLGHFPDSFTHSTLGGWVATRSSGMQSDRYGDIADITRGLRVVRPGGILALRPLPGTATGPSVREMILGSEGRLGVITEVTVQVHPIAANREVIAYLFPTWANSLKAMNEIRLSDVTPTFTRVSDAHETIFSLATQKAPANTKKKLAAKGQDVLFDVLRRRGWDLDEKCLSYVCYEGSKEHIARDKASVKSIVKRAGGITLGSGPGALYDQKKFDTPYIRDFLLDRGAIGDVSETAAPWSKLQLLHANVYEGAQAAFDELGKTGWIMSHMSHSYHSGACLYFTFGFAHGDDSIGEYQRVKNAIQQAFIESDGTLSHHHAVGTEHQPWIEDDLSPEGAKLLSELFAADDPARRFNPGKIVS